MSRASRRCVDCQKPIRPRGDSVRCRECAAEHVWPQPVDEQMAALFYDYESTPNVVVDSRPDGTRLVSLSDTQYPFVDEPLLSAVHEFIKDWQPNDLIYNGDILDYYEISDFDKRPGTRFGIDDEEEWARQFMDLHARLVPGVKQFFIEGNHEERLTRATWREAGKFASHVKTLPQVLGLKERGIEHVPYGKHVEYLGFVFTHGNFVSADSAMTARRHMALYRSSGVNGHTHRLGSFSKTDMNRRSHTWLEQGCLCRLDLEYVKAHPDWQQGFLIGYVYGGALHPQLIHVIEANGQRGFVAAGNYYPIGRS